MFVITECHGDFPVLAGPIPHPVTVFHHVVILQPCFHLVHAVDPIPLMFVGRPCDIRYVVKIVPGGHKIIGSVHGFGYRPTASASQTLLSMYCLFTT